MGQLRTATRAYALDGHGPAEVAGRMNALVHTLDLGHMTTLVYLIFEPGTGRVRFTCAGHPPPIVRRPDGSADFLDAGRSLPLGVVPSAIWDEGDTCLEPGSTLVLYTDGLVEERGVPLGEGLDDLRRALCTAPEEPEALCDHLLDSRLHGRRDDDVAVLALRALPRGNELLLRSPLDPARLYSLRGIMREWLTEADATSAETYEITTAFGEAITNAMEHPLGREQAAFEARVSLDGREVAIAVRDFGHWRPPRPSDRGRGLNLMEALMHSVDIEPSPKGTEVRMRRKLDPVSDS
jgi:anti-sigma regulatory factor (Ser/Thr protein kinase)